MDAPPALTPPHQRVDVPPVLIPRRPPAGNVVTDTTNGFLMTMDDNVDAFNANIQKNPNLANLDGINCVGFSQGNSGEYSHLASIQPN